MDDRTFTKQIKMSLDNNLSEDCVLKFDFITSLQNIVMAKIICNSWMNANIQKEIVDLHHEFIRRRRNLHNGWHQIVDNVTFKVSDLHLPVSVIKRLKNIVSDVGISLFNWIMYHDEHVFNTHRKSKYCAVDLMSNIVWSSRGKIDYSETAKNMLTNNSTFLSNDHKYKLACTYCLKDTIAVLFPVVVDKYYLKSVCIDYHPMVYFWTARLTGDDSIFYEVSYSEQYIPSLPEMSIDEHIMQLLISCDSRVKRTFNEIPIRYMLGILNEEEKAKYIIRLIKEIGSQNLRYSLLSNQNCEQQKSSFKECSGTILDGILKDWLWRDYFLQTALHVLDIMDPHTYLHILNEINEEKLRIHKENKYVYNEYKFFLKRIWLKAPRHLKDFLFEHEKGSSFEELIFSLLWEQDMDLVESMLKDLNTQQKKNIILRKKGIEHCSYLIQNDRWDLLEIFIKYTISCEEDISLLKQYIFEKQGRAIGVHFLEQNAFNKIEYFMTWAFQSEKEMDKFRKNLYSAKYKTTFKAFISNNKADFTELENLFKWCAGGNHEDFLQFKSKSLWFYYGKRFICDSIEQDKYELLDEVLNWRFSNNAQQISQFKNNMHKDLGGLSSCISSTICVLIRKDNSLKTLDKFIDWSFSDEQEVEEFKKWLLYPKPLSGYVFYNLLEQNQFEIADKLLQKFIISSREISEFKRELMVSEHIIFIFHTHDEDERLDDMSLLVKWFNPSPEMVKNFKSIYPKSQASTMIFKLMDNIVENDQCYN